ALTYTVKLSVRRHRPPGGGGKCCSFPSGHASSTFALASVLWRHLGWKAAVPTYTVASYVALSRLHEDVHFLSDVVFGSAIGIVSGRAVVHHDRHFYGMRIQPMPVPGGGGGVMVAGSFRGSGTRGRHCASSCPGPCSPLPPPPTALAWGPTRPVTPGPTPTAA